MIWRIIATVLLIALAACSNLGDIMNSLNPISDPNEVIGAAIRGEEIFRVGIGDAPPCSACHLAIAGGSGFSLGPNLSGIAIRSAGRVEGMTAEQYIENSILFPKDYIVFGYRVSMFTEYRTHLSEQDIADLIAYLMTL